MARVTIVPMVDVVAYHRATEISKISKLMRYGADQFKEDWDVAIALSVLMATGNPDNFQEQLDGCFQRILAYLKNDHWARPF
jgi:hypothetical protein